MTLDWSKSRLAIAACVLLLLSVIWPPDTIADTHEDLEPEYLVVIAYGNWEDLQRLMPLELDLLDLQKSALAAIVTPTELDALRSMGFAVRILDTPATPERYYLVSLPPSADTAPLYRHGQVFSYVAGTVILKAGPAEAESLPAEGFFIKKLFGPIPLPTSSTEVAAAIPIIQESDALIQDLVNAVSQTQIYNTIRDLQDDDSLPGWDALRSRYSYSPELAIERDYIRDRLSALGLDIRYHDFSLYGIPLDNVEGTLNGWGPESDAVYIVCAHYDSTSEAPYYAAPGADDNASGTAAVLEAARVLSQYRFRHTLRFVTFAAEEQGLIGSYYYAAEARAAGTDIGGVVNLDMIAWDSNHDDAMEVHAGTRSNSQALGTAFLDAMSTYGISLAPQYVTSGAATFSDHSRFWDQGYPAMLAIEDFDDFNGYYHKTGDTLDKLDLDYATEFVQTAVATLAELAEIIPPGVSVEHTGPSMVMSDTLATLTITYSNPGPNLATGVVMTDTLSAGLAYVGDNSALAVTQPASDTVVWQVGDLMPYSRSSFVVTVAVAAAAPAGSPVTSTVDITGTTTWDDPQDNRATWTGLVLHTRLFLPLLLKNRW